MSLLNFSIETSLFRSWNTRSVGASLATTWVDDHCVRCEVLVALGAKIMVLLDVLPLSLVAQDEGCGGTCSFNFHFPNWWYVPNDSIATYRVYL